MRKYGWIKDAPDNRDHKFKLPAPGNELVMPETHDLTGFFPPVMNQGQFGTCTAHGVTAAFRYNRINNDYEDIPLSRAQLYWDSGVIGGDTNDTGRQIRDVIKSITSKGVAREELWGYEKVGVEPPPSIYEDARSHFATEYQRVDVDRISINTAIFIGHPVIIGIPVYKQFESDEAAATGVIRMPSFGDTEIGEHCMLLGGYSPGADRVMNSWGTGWGDAGYCSLPRGYVEKYGSDLWTIFMDN